MRSKALLVGAQASFVGPWVNIEEGEWLVEPPSSITLERREGEGVRRCQGGTEVHITGPACIRAVVATKYEGNGVHLDTRMLS